jgi:hypothetical protein
VARAGVAARRAQEEQHAQAVAACARPEVRASRALGRRRACGSRRQSRVGAGVWIGGQRRSVQNRVLLALAACGCGADAGAARRPGDAGAKRLRRTSGAAAARAGARERASG